MVGYLYERQPERGWERLRRHPPAQVRLEGLSLLGMGLPPGGDFRSLDRGARALRKKGCARALTQPELRCPELPDILRRNGLNPIDPLPLCRAKAPELALTQMEALPLRRRCVALRGENAGVAWVAAAALCPQVGTLLLDFDRGEEALAQRLRAVYGAAALGLRQGPPPQVSVEFAPRSPEGGKTLRLWGTPDLAGGRLAAGEVDDLPLLTLLWETGRLRLEDIVVRCGKTP